MVENKQGYKGDFIMDSNFQNVETMDVTAAHDVATIQPAITTVDIATSQDVETASVNLTKVIRDCNTDTLSTLKFRLNHIDACLNRELNDIESRMNAVDNHLKDQDNDYDVLLKQLKELRDDVRTAFRLQVKFMMYSLAGVFGAIVIAAFTIIQLLGG